jgi:hypothetical protein
MLVILATQEAEIRRIVVWSQSQQILCKTLFRIYPTYTKKGWQSGSRYRPWIQAPGPHIYKKKSQTCNYHLTPQLHPLAFIPENAKPCSHKNCRCIIMAALFLISPNWKQPRCSSAGEGLNKLWCIRILEHNNNKREWTTDNMTAWIKLQRITQ